MILDVVFQLDQALVSVDFSEGTHQINIDFGEIHKVGNDDIPIYDGSYEVTPTLNDQSLATAGHLMAEDLMIEPIPIYVVSNNSGGTTVTIG